MHLGYDAAQGLPTVIVSLVVDRWARRSAPLRCRACVIVIVANAVPLAAAMIAVRDGVGVEAGC